MDSIYFMCGEVREMLKELPDGCIQACVTSPPYYGLRNYGLDPVVWDGDSACQHFWGDEAIRIIGGGLNEDFNKRWGQGSGQKKQEAIPRQKISAGAFCSKCGAWLGCLGLEPTVDDFVRHLVQVFAEVRRVLRDDGCFWVNIGDSYTSGGRSTRASDRKLPQREMAYRAPTSPGLKSKDLCLVPQRLLIALQDDGWWVRQVCIWHKPNAMPSSVTDRPATDYEYVFQLAKRENYYYDRYAVLKPYTQVQKGNAATFKRNGSKREVPIPGQTVGTHRPDREDDCYGHGGRNLRAVWTIPTQSFREAHFATFPETLVEQILRASTSEHGACAQCGAPYRRIVEKGEPLEEWRASCGADSGGEYHGTAQKDYVAAGAQNASATKARILAGMVARRTVGWQKTCGCETDEVVPCLVMDPFAGSGTTGLVAKQLGLRAILCDQNAEYVRMAQKRCGVPDET